MNGTENLSEYIEDEIRDAEKYARCAVDLKNENPEIAEMFHQMSTEEMGHAKMMYDAAMGEVKNLLNEYNG